MDDYLYESYVAAQVAMCQDDYCTKEHCDLGGGDCQSCQNTRLGLKVCGYCGKPWDGNPKVCPINKKDV